MKKTVTPQRKATNWYAWAGIKPTSREALIEEAERMKLPIFEDDSDDKIYNRIYNAKVLTANRRTLKLNGVLCIISTVAAMASVVQALPKH